MPILDEDLAPCFEVARYFAIYDIASPVKITSSIEKCTGCEGFGRVRFLQDNKINVLICSGIKAFYRDLLITSGIKVISNVCSSTSDALNDFLLKKLKFDESDIVKSSALSPIPRDDLICWARDLFESNGYKTSSIDALSRSLIDFVAEIDCPVCSRPIRVAVCCGAHSYNFAQEIKHFHYATSSKYQSKVYIYTANSELIQICQEYDVELIDPEMEESLFNKPSAGKVPLLHIPIQGHEKAFQSSGKLRNDKRR